MKNYYLVTIRSTQLIDVFSATAVYQPGDDVMVRSERGLEIGRIRKSIDIRESLGRIIKSAETKDIEKHWDNVSKGNQARDVCIDAIQRLKLNMKVVSAYYNFDQSKLFVEYYSDERVDFRMLLRELAALLRVRIELKQIGSRDHAKRINAIGTCGSPTCCSRFKHSFETITITMAKNQRLPINSTSLSGMCGKLKCCLAYEDEFYKECRSRFPKVNATILYQDKKYQVKDVNCCINKIRIKSTHEDLSVGWEDIKVLDHD